MLSAFHVALGAALALLAQAVVGTLRTGSAFDLDRSKRVAGLWAMNLGLIVMLLGLTLGYWAGLRSNPMSCDEVKNLTSAVQGLNIETADATRVVAQFGQMLDRQYLLQAEVACATQRRHTKGC